MTTAAQLLKQIDAAEANANLDLSGVKKQNAASAAILKEDSKQALVVLREQYGRYVKEKSYVLGLQGAAEDQQEFARLARAEGAVVVDSLQLYKDLAERVEPSIGQARVFGVTQITLLVRAMEEMLASTGLQDIPFPALTEIQNVPTTEALVTLIKDLVERAAGIGPNAAYVRSLAVSEALKTRYTQSVVPVVLLNANPSSVAGLSSLALSGESLIVPLEPGKVTSESVIDAFKTILTNLQTKHPKPNQ